MNHEKVVKAIPALQGCPLCLILDFLDWLSKEGLWTCHPVEDEGLLRAYVMDKRDRRCQQARSPCGWGQDDKEKVAAMPMAVARTRPLMSARPRSG